ncbi:MAG: hypothetical protein GW948_02220 [Rhodobacterales bacterium]|nr:hypothetical protein [Rhodobacterales bacterium]
MSYRVSMVFSADGKAAKAEIDGLAAAQVKAGASAETLGRKGATAAAGTRGLGSAAAQAEAQVEALAAAQVRAAASADAVAQNNRVAAGSVGNLFAQFNDIGVMMAAGQNPLQLAIQQGAQINQVIGPMGAAGAVRALGGAFMQMLSPINLITFATIAAGAAMFQWLTSSHGDAVELTDLIDQSTDAIEAFGDASDRARLSTAQMVDEFGTASPALRAVLEDLAQIGRLEAFEGIDAVTESLRDMVFDMNGGATRFFNLGSIGSSARDMRVELSRNIALMDEAVDPAVRLQAAMDLREFLQANSGGIANMTSRQREFSEGLAAVIRDMTILGVKIDEAAEVTPDWANLADIGANAQRVALMRDVATAEAQAAEQAARRQVSDEAAGRAMLQSMSEQATLATLIARYGEDSRQVTEERAAQERRAFDAMLNTSTASAALKDELRLSFDIMQMMAGAPIAAPISAAASEAARMAANLEAAAAAIAGIRSAVPSATVTNVGNRARLEALAAGESVATAAAEARLSEERYRNRDAFGSGDAIVRAAAQQEFAALEAELRAGASLQEQIDAQMESRRPAAGGARGGGGAESDLQKQRDAVDDLIASLEDELAILRETDPVQQEMLRHREALSAATSAERAEVEALITAREAETRAAEAQAETWDFVRQSSFDIIDEMTRKGATLSDVMGGVADMIREAVLQAALLGEGPLAGLFGTAGSGILDTLLRGVFPSLAPTPVPIPGAATGAYIHGRGDGTSDDVLMFGSSGEMIMNARATRQHRHLLEAMNGGGAIPGYATGGMIGGGRASSAYDGPLVVIEDRTSGKVSFEQRDEVDASGRRRSRLIMADAVGEALTTKGGGANRTLRNSFGVKPRGTLR